MNAAEIKSRPKGRTFIGLLFLTALVLRTFRAWQETIVNPDIMRYVDQARGLLVDPLKTLRSEIYHPLHAALACAVHQIVAGAFADDRMAWIWSLKIVGIVAGSIVAVEIFLLARVLGASFWAAMLAAAVWITGRRTSVFGGDGMSDMLALAFFGAAMLAGIGAILSGTRRNNALRWLLVGICSGFAYLARPEGMVGILIFTTTCGVLVIDRRASWNWRKAAAAILFVLVGFVLISSPYMTAIGGFTGKRAEGGAIVGRVIDGDGASFLLNASAKLFRELGETFSWASLVLLLAVFVIRVLTWWQAGNSKSDKAAVRLRPELRWVVWIWFGLWMAVMFWLMHRARYLDGRHTLPLLLLMFGLLGPAIDDCRRCTQKVADAAIGKILPGILIALLLFPGCIMFYQPTRGDKQYYIDAANLLRARVADGVIICDLERLAGYYSGHPYAQWHGSPADPRMDEIDAIREVNAGAPLILGKVYLLASGQVPAEEIGPYWEFARFTSRTATKGDVYVLYARPDEPALKPVATHP